MKIDYMEDGASFGELALLSDKPRMATIIATEETHLAFLTKI